MKVSWNALAQQLAARLRNSPAEAPARALRSWWWDVSGRVPQHERYDRLTVQVIERVVEPDANCVDIGAHRGTILEAMLRAAPAGRHVAFEPLPQLAHALQESFPMVEVHACALADVTGSVEFTHVVSAPAYSGIRDRTDLPVGVATERLRVPVERLDDQLDPELPVAFIKVDVEGAELLVLRGALQTLQRWRPVVVFEHGIGGADAYGAQPAAIAELFASASMHISRLADWLGGEPPLHREEFERDYATGREYVFVAHPISAMS